MTKVWVTGPQAVCELEMVKPGDEVKHDRYGKGIVIWVYRGAALVVKFADGKEREVAEADVERVDDAKR